uniref:Uncharacterized protein n=1 Tax=Ciona savignyi TaxID=51511 RepID=H2YX95_CIOSA
MTAHPWVRSTPVIVQPSISRVASPYPPAQNMTPTFNNPNTYPQQFQPQVAPNTLLPVAYSLRVTMAMAGDLNTDTLAPPTIPRLNFTNQPRKPTNTCPRHPNQPSNQQINQQSMVNQSPQTGNVPNHAPENQTSTESAADQASALERLIEFYSAKNKLTAE